MYLQGGRIMEAVGAGLEALGSAISAIAGWAGAVGIVGIAAITFLIYTKTVSFEDIKDFFKRDRRYR